MGLRDELAEIVNSDLENEWLHLTFYTRAAAMVRGIHRNHLAEFLKQQARSELDHVMEFSDHVVSLGGVPTEGYTEMVTSPTCPAEILEMAIQLEQQVVSNYANTLNYLNESLEGLDGEELELMARLQYLVAFYSKQLEDSHSDLDNLRGMARWVD